MEGKATQNLWKVEANYQARARGPAQSSTNQRRSPVRAETHRTRDPFFHSASHSTACRIPGNSKDAPESHGESR